MEHTEELPNTLGALYARERELLHVLKPLTAKWKSAETKKEKRRIKEQMRPDYEVLQAIRRKVKDLEQSATEVDQYVGSLINDNREAAPAVPPKSNLTNAPAALHSSAVPPKPDLTHAPADTSPLPQILNSSIPPKQPKTTSATTDHAVPRFITDGKAHCFGCLDKSTTRDPVIQGLMDVTQALLDLSVVVLIIGLHVAADVLAWMAEGVRNA